MAITEFPQGATRGGAGLGDALEPPQPGMRNVPLGTLIFRAGLLTSEQLEEALQEAARGRKRLGDVLLERRLIAEGDLARLVAGQKGLPYLELSGLAVDPEVAQGLPYATAWELGALPVCRHEGRVIVAVADPSEESEQSLRGELEDELQLAVAARSEIVAALGALHEEPGAAAAPPNATPAPPPAVTIPEEPVAPVSALRTAGPARPAPRPAGGGMELEAQTVVVLRIADGERVQLGSFGEAEEARQAAEDLVKDLRDASSTTWPFIRGRYIRPESILAIELVEERVNRWIGSVGRTRWSGREAEAPAR